MLGVRPDAVTVVPADTPGAVSAEIYSNEPFGKHAILTLDLGGLLVKAKTTMAVAGSLGEGGGIGRPVGLASCRPRG